MLPALRRRCTGRAGSRLLAGCGTGELKIFSSLTTRPLLSVPCHSAPIIHVATVPAPAHVRRAWAACESARRHSQRGGGVVHTLQQHERDVRDAHDALQARRRGFVPAAAGVGTLDVEGLWGDDPAGLETGHGPSLIMTVGMDTEAKLWRAAALDEPVLSIDGCCSAAFSRAGDRVVCGVADTHVGKVFSVETVRVGVRAWACGHGRAGVRAGAHVRRVPPTHTPRRAQGQLIATLAPPESFSSNHYRLNRPCFSADDSLLLCDGALWDARAARMVHKFDKLSSGA